MTRPFARTPLRTFNILVASTALSTATFSPATFAQSVDCQITLTSIGPVHLGMTLQAAKAAWPQASVRLADGPDNLLVLQVRQGQDLLLSGPLGDRPPAGQTLPDSTRLNHLDTFSQRCRDEHGIGPGTKLSDAAARLGGVQDIVMSEIESRQYVTFQRQPPGRWYRIDESGVFTAGSPRHTTQFQPEARILSVGIEAAARP